MFTLIVWGVFGLIVGMIAKAIHPGEDPIGFLPTIGIGVVGSYIGGAINWLLDMGSSPFEPSGFFNGHYWWHNCLCWMEMVEFEEFFRRSTQLFNRS